LSEVSRYVRIFEASVATIVGAFVATAIALAMEGFASLIPLALVIYIAVVMLLHVAFFYPRAISIAVSKGGYAITVSTPVGALSFEVSNIALSDINIVGTPILGIRVGNLTLGIFKNLLDGRVACFAKYSTGILAEATQNLAVFLGTRDLDALVTCLEGGGALCIA